MLFGTIAVLGGYLDGFSSEEATGWRVIFIVIALGLVHISLAQRRGLGADVRRLFRSIKLIVVFGVCTVIMWFELWVFMWGSANGHTQDVAMGYFLLPLVMVLMGRVIFGDRMTRWQAGAVISAACGVAAQLVITRSIGWPVLLIAGLYPVYFALRRWYGLDTKHIFLLETIVLLVPAGIFIAGGAFAQGVVPDSTVTLLIVVALSGIAMTLYIVASTWLPLGLFGLLSYLEPLLLLGAAVILGYVLAITDVFIYGPILVAIGLLIVGGVRGGKKITVAVSGQAALTTDSSSISVVRMPDTTRTPRSAPPD